MRKVKWSEIDIEDELRRLEALLSTSLYMNFDDETEYSVAMDLISMSLSRSLLRALLILKTSLMRLWLNPAIYILLAHLPSIVRSH
ncbi:hypothetical protein B4U25_43630 [Klebsiella pneumoniae]|nr:hypothetical protein B4U25_43630 [Klebsiella pneumoniae]